MQNFTELLPWTYGRTVFLFLTHTRGGLRLPRLSTANSSHDAFLARQRCFRSRKLRWAWYESGEREHTLLQLWPHQQTLSSQSSKNNTRRQYASCKTIKKCKLRYVNAKALVTRNASNSGWWGIFAFTVFSAFLAHFLHSLMITRKNLTRIISSLYQN